mgnify:FL=1|tara:strand:- start:2300 stop:3703 length:1404 start_codon:yes stop_codon:yes gene_type:complete
MITIDYDTSYRKGRLIADDDILSMIRNHFSVAKAGIFFAKKRNKNIPTRDYAIQASGMFDFGMYNEIRKYLIESQITEITYTEAFANRLKVGFDAVELSTDLMYELRDYQADALEKAFKRGQGTIVVATGGGKSLIQANLLETYKKMVKSDFKCILIVPGLSLVSQLVKDFKEYGCSFTYSGWVGGSEPEDVQVIIVNSENFCSQFGNYKNLSEVDLVLVDECHKIKHGNKLTKLIHKIKTPNKFGFTGTLPKTEIDIWKVIGTFGPVIYEKKSKDLRDDGYLTNVVIKCIKLIHPNVGKMNYQNELKYLHNSDPRSSVISKIVQKLDNNVLILVNRIEHGQYLEGWLATEGKVVYFISGEMPVDERTAIIARMETETNLVVIAMSSIFSTGINVKNLPYIMFVDGGKSFIRTIQSIGRGLRLHKFKKLLVIFDIYDTLKYSTEHSERRQEFYDDEDIKYTEIEITI